MQVSPLQHQQDLFPQMPLRRLVNPLLKSSSQKFSTQLLASALDKKKTDDCLWRQKWSSLHLQDWWNPYYTAFLQVPNTIWSTIPQDYSRNWQKQGGGMNFACLSKSWVTGCRQKNTQTPFLHPTLMWALNMYKERKTFTWLVCHSSGCSNFQSNSSLTGVYHDDILGLGVFVLVWRCVFNNQLLNKDIYQMLQLVTCYKIKAKQKIASLNPIIAPAICG